MSRRDAPRTALHEAVELSFLLDEELDDLFSDWASANTLRSRILSAMRWYRTSRNYNAAEFLNHVDARLWRAMARLSRLERRDSSPM